MATQVERLRAERSAVWDQMQSVMAEAEKDGWSGELEQKYDRLEAQLDAVGDRVRALEEGTAADKDPLQARLDRLAARPDPGMSR